MDQNQSESQVGTRKYLTAEQKFKIIKEQLTTKTPMTEICKKYGINASQFYRWQEQFFAGARAGFEISKRTGSATESPATKKIEELERELKRRQEVILEFAVENITLKKMPGTFTLTR